MLSDFTPMPTLAVKDLAAARAFYEGVLGFAPTGDGAEMVLYSSGAGQFLVYPSSFAGTNKATYMAFQVPADAFDSQVESLRSQGIEFQTFDYPGITWTEGIADMGGQRAVWFADPDGNILTLETAA